KRPVEVNMANNVRADLLLVSEDKFRKTDRGEGFGYVLQNDYIIGNYYKINENIQERLILDNINFSAFGMVGEPMAGKEVVAYLLKIDDNVKEDLSDWNINEATSNKKSIVAIGSYTFSRQDDEPGLPVDHRFEVTELLDIESSSDQVILEPGA